MDSLLTTLLPLIVNDEY